MSILADTARPDAAGELSPAVIKAIADEILGASSALDAHVCEKYGIDDLDDIAAEFDLERCEVCGYWHDASDLISADGETVPCESCR